MSTATEPRPAVIWAGCSSRVERVVRDLMASLHQRGLLADRPSEKDCSRATAALSDALGTRHLGELDRAMERATALPGRPSRRQEEAERYLRRDIEHGRAGGDAVALLLDLLDETRTGRPPAVSAHDTWSRAAGHLWDEED